jgi:hypothetical protein
MRQAHDSQQQASHPAPRTSAGSCMTEQTRHNDIARAGTAASCATDSDCAVQDTDMRCADAWEATPPTHVERSLLCCVQQLVVHRQPHLQLGFLCRKPLRNARPYSSTEICQQKVWDFLERANIRKA